MEPWRAIFEAIARDAAARGLDLAAAGRADDYDRQVDAPWRLPDVGRPDALVIVLGHTRALWPRLIAALDADPELRDGPDPLDTWTERTARDSAARHLTGVRYALRYPHEAPPRRVAFQRLADAVGLGQLGPAMLCVDEDHGPWLGLRAAFIIDVPGPATPPRRPRPCDACATRPCVAALDVALARSSDSDDLWPFLAVRDACPVGREHRYGPRHLGYHYTKDRAMLRAEDGAADTIVGGTVSPAPPHPRDASNP